MYVFGPFRFDATTGHLWRDSDQVALPPRAQALLEYLLSRAGLLVTREELLSAAWGDVHVSDTSLKEAVHVLRLALGDDPKTPSYIETVPRRGYRFIAAVRAPGRDQTGREQTGRAQKGRAQKGQEQTPGRRVIGGRVAGWAVALTIGLGLLVFFLAYRPTRKGDDAVVPHRFEIPLPLNHVVTAGPPNLALSPDGRLLIYVAKSQRRRQLFLRPVDRLDATALEGTQGARAPFFSPDGAWIGFLTEDAVKRVPVVGGAVETLCEIHRGLSAVWGPAGIVLSQLDSRDNTGLWTIPAVGGRPRVLTTRDAGESAHRWPEVLLGGPDRFVLFTAWRTSFDDAETVLLDLDSGKRTVLFNGSQARYAAGRLVFFRQRQLWSVPFDPSGGKVMGSPIPVLGGVATTPIFGTAHFAVAPTGSLVYMSRGEPSPPVLRRISGQPGQPEERRTIDVDGTVADLRLTRDGLQMAMTMQSDDGLDIWTFDLQRGSVARRTSDKSSLGPVWSPDGRWLLHGSTRMDSNPVLGVVRQGVVRGDAVRRDAVGGGKDEKIWLEQVPTLATSWSVDGKKVALSRWTPDQGWDLWTLDLDGKSVVAEPWLATPFNESRGVYSPDGRFVAYESDETGRKEILVRPASGGGPPWSISVEGGSHPLWSANGQTIWYRLGEQIYSVAVHFEEPVAMGLPEARFQAPDLQGYNMALDGEDVWLLEPTPGTSTLVFVVNALRTSAVPPQTVPPQTVPPQTVPPQTVPPQTVPPQTVPPQTVPPQTVPPQTVPPKSM